METVFIQNKTANFENPEWVDIKVEKSKLSKRVILSFCS